LELNEKIQVAAAGIKRAIRAGAKNLQLLDTIKLAEIAQLRTVLVDQFRGSPPHPL
jgi:hypothetical protein